MADEPEYQLGAWHIEYRPDEPHPLVVDAEGRLVATVHGDDDRQMLDRALLIAKAPSLREAAILAFQSFRVIAANDWGGASEAAAKLLPYYEAVVHALVPDDGGGNPA